MISEHQTWLINTIFGTNYRASKKKGGKDGKAAPKKKAAPAVRRFGTQATILDDEYKYFHAPVPDPVKFPAFIGLEFGKPSGDKIGVTGLLNKEKYPDCPFTPLTQTNNRVGNNTDLEGLVDLRAVERMIMAGADAYDYSPKSLKEEVFPQIEINMLQDINERRGCSYAQPVEGAIVNAMEYSDGVMNTRHRTDMWMKEDGDGIGCGGDYAACANYVFVDNMPIVHVVKGQFDDRIGEKWKADDTLEYDEYDSDFSLSDLLAKPPEGHEFGSNKLYHDEPMAEYQVYTVIPWISKKYAVMLSRHNLLDMTGKDRITSQNNVYHEFHKYHFPKELSAGDYWKKKANWYSSHYPDGAFLGQDVKKSDDNPSSNERNARIDEFTEDKRKRYEVWNDPATEMQVREYAIATPDIGDYGSFKPAFNKAFTGIDSTRPISWKNGKRAEDRWKFVDENLLLRNTQEKLVIDIIADYMCHVLNSDEMNELQFEHNDETTGPEDGGPKATKLESKEELSKVQTKLEELINTQFKAYAENEADDRIQSLVKVLAAEGNDPRTILGQLKLKHTRDWNQALLGDPEPAYNSVAIDGIPFQFNLGVMGEDGLQLETYDSGLITWKLWCVSGAWELDMFENDTKIDEIVKTRIAAASLPKKILTVNEISDKHGGESVLKPIAGSKNFERTTLVKIVGDDLNLYVNEGMTQMGGIYMPLTGMIRWSAGPIAEAQVDKKDMDAIVRFLGTKKSTSGIKMGDKISKAIKKHPNDTNEDNEKLRKLLDSEILSSGNELQNTIQLVARYIRRNNMISVGGSKMVNYKDCDMKGAKVLIDRLKTVYKEEIGKIPEQDLETLLLG